MNPFLNFFRQMWHIVTASIFWLVVFAALIVLANQDKFIKMMNLPNTGYVESKTKDTVVIRWNQPFKNDTTIYYDARK